MEQHFHDLFCGLEEGCPADCRHYEGRECTASWRECPRVEEAVDRVTDLDPTLDYIEWIEWALGNTRRLSPAWTRWLEDLEPDDILGYLRRRGIKC